MHINIQYSESSLFDSCDGEALAKIDESASAMRYGEMVEAELARCYPAATTHIALGINDCVIVNGHDDNEEEPWISQIIAEVFHGWDWIIEKETL